MKKLLLLPAVLASVALAVVGIAAPAQAAFQAKPCATAHLTGKLLDGGGGAAGSIYAKLVLKNTGAHSCTLQGWPGVSLVGHGTGAQLGAAAKQDRSTSHATVTIKPGKHATAPLRIVQAANYPTSTCGSVVAADGLRVYPPGSKKSLFVKAGGVQACSSSAVKLLTISALHSAS